MEGASKNRKKAHLHTTPIPWIGCLFFCQHVVPLDWVVGWFVCSCRMRTAIVFGYCFYEVEFADSGPVLQDIF